MGGEVLCGDGDRCGGSCDEKWGQGMLWIEGSGGAIVAGARWRRLQGEISGGRGDGGRVNAGGEGGGGTSTARSCISATL